jgi:large subunit ribosomal protein L24
MPARIRRGDTVAVISGDDRGKRGRVLRVIPESDKVVVEGVNVITKHLRKSQQNPQGGRVRREAPLPACKVMPVDPETNKPTRVKSGTHEGRKVRLGVRSGARIDTAAPTRREKAARKAAGAAAAESEE